ncbi:hypothetical protein [Micromonospora sp. NPDC093277]|uniref:hypothetical protein n=1 Tax=Micromonospora sp. NPDC093277 TaxID=3364291 RepID=UPI0037F7641A
MIDGVPPRGGVGTEATLGSREGADLAKLALSLAEAAPYDMTDEGDIVVQGYQLTDPEALVQLRDVLPNETFVVVPRELMSWFEKKG